MLLAPFTNIYSKSEFADALGMRPHDHFVQRMFACMAQNAENGEGGTQPVQDDAVCFQQFLVLVVSF